MTDDLALHGLLLSVLLFAILALSEAIFPRRKRLLARFRRWRTNIIFIILDSVALRLMGPVAAIAVAGLAAQNQIGLFNWTDWPVWVEFALALILLDLAIYGQHIATHKIPLLWAVHKVHHADRDIDVTTAIRFHPVEMILSMLYKCGLVLLLGPSPLAVFVFALLLNLCAMFNHSNLRLPQWLDKGLRLLLVTPDMHRVHHSTVRGETDSNYGFSIALWDRIFGTYIAQPEAGHDKMTIGLEEYQIDSPAELWWSLALPFQQRNRTNNARGYKRNST
ncbi:sterol desaturase family protein [Sphingorhabdus sp. SMR4y]|uniref:sterol desaturase family protein n=1 Tax=Sphingorhabdus sp. SMR4y TaxID=2584094 RepID=UPI000B5CEDA3|nr:sterol desaturase family protein [Sphingorhabdus sp. SMR4y]ASK87927.1 fatty acid hydroxylase superfamily protein [Sphingorhabdus sp. SMR4y]